MTHKAKRPGGHKKDRGERQRAQGNPARGVGIVANPAPVERLPGAGDWSDEKADLICARLAEGTSLYRITRDPAMPCLPTVYKWMRERPTFAANYARARLDQADTYADESVEIADTPQIGVKVKTGPNGIETTTADMTEHRKLRIDTRKWFASVTNPKYRQKVDTRLIAQMMPAPDTSSMISDDDAAMSYRALLPMPVRNDV